MGIDQLSEYYYTGDEARKKLGMTRDAFNHYVKKGVIHKKMVFGQHARYEKQEIDLIARQFEAAILAAQGHSYVYRTATVDDLDTASELGRLIFGEKAFLSEMMNAMKAFVKANPQISHHLYDKDRLVASIDIVPFKHEAILEFKEGRKSWSFGPEMIEQFVPDKALECVFVDIMSTPLVASDLRQRYIIHLLREFARKTLRTWGSQGVEIVSLYAAGVTPQGRHMLEGGGFTFLGKRKGRAIYELGVGQASTPLLKPYKTALAEYKAKKAQ
jgi:hypothetical protein